MKLIVDMPDFLDIIVQISFNIEPLFANNMQPYLL